MDDCKGTVSSRHNRIDAHANSQILWQDTGTYTGSSPRSPALRGRSGHGILTLTKKLFAIDTCWQMEKSVFLYRMSLGISTILQGRAHTKDNLTNTK